MDCIRLAPKVDFILLELLALIKNQNGTCGHSKKDMINGIHKAVNILDEHEAMKRE